jgi:hypothetical protein
VPFRRLRGTYPGGLIRPRLRSSRDSVGRRQQKLPQLARQAPAALATSATSELDGQRVAHPVTGSCDAVTLRALLSGTFLALRSDNATRRWRKSLISLVGGAGFEPATPAV